MNKKMITHGLMITAILVAVFVSAAFTSEHKAKNTTESYRITNIAKVDFENNTLGTGNNMIAENNIPLASAPSSIVANASVLWIIISVSALIIGIVIYEDYKDKRSEL